MNQGLFLKYSFSMIYKKGCSPGGITCQAQTTDNQLFALFYFIYIRFYFIVLAIDYQLFTFPKTKYLTNFSTIVLHCCPFSTSQFGIVFFYLFVGKD